MRGPLCILISGYLTCQTVSLSIGIIERAFSRFDTKNVVEVARLEEGLNVLELWHGPTLAFKDLALSCVGQLVEYFLNKRQKHVTILVGMYNYWYHKK